MKLNEIKINEVDKILEMYNEFRKKVKINSVKEYCENYLTRCACCGEIVYDSDMKEFDGVMYCEECYDVVSEEKVAYDIDPYDVYMDMLLEGGCA